MQVVMDLPQHPEVIRQVILTTPMERQSQPLPQVKPYPFHIPQLQMVITWNISNYGLILMGMEF
jgi:hypothetical protein